MSKTEHVGFREELHDLYHERNDSGLCALCAEQLVDSLTSHGGWQTCFCCARRAYLGPPPLCEELLGVLRAVKGCPIEHDENNHAYIKVDARSIFGTGAMVSAALEKATPAASPTGATNA